MNQVNIFYRVFGAMLLLAGISACGGGGSAGGLIAEITTGGSGFAKTTSIGSITGFGSIIVNGIRFDETSAAINLDGATGKSPSDLKLGMFVNVNGVATSSATGTAQAIDVYTLASGPVSKLGATGFSILGSTFIADAKTIYDGYSGLNAMVANENVKVWGTQNNGAGSQWLASRVERIPGNPATFVMSGPIASLSGTSFKIATVTVNAMNADLSGLAGGLGNAAIVRAEGSLTNDGTLIASRIRTLANTIPSSAVDAELEGVVTAFNSNADFQMGSLRINAGSATLSPANLVLRTGIRIEVEGSNTNGILIAKKVSLEDGSQAQEVEIEGTIQQFSNPSNFVVRGTTIDASAAQFSGGKITDLKLGLKIHLHGNNAGSIVKATEVEIQN